MSFRKFLEEKRQIILNNGKRYGQIVFLAGGSACFKDNTLIKTKNGNKKISEIEIGEEVLSYNVETKQEEYQPVLNVFEHTDTQKPMIQIDFDDGSRVVCTEDHKFFYNEKWVTAKELLEEQERI